MIAWFKNANVVHMGDIIFSDMFHFVEVDHGGINNGMSIEEMIEDEVLKEWEK